MARLVYFHIGVPKSGATFLQTAMWHNRRQLGAQGFLYPGAKRVDHFHASTVVREAAASVREADNAWRKIVDELRSWDGTGLVSHEFFGMASAEQACRAVEALGPAEVRVVLTARDYVRQFPAVWQEAVKMGSELPLDAFMAAVFDLELSGAWSWNSQDVPAILARWSEAVPREHVQVITVPPANAPRELLWRRWCEALQIDDSDFDMDLTFANESLGATQVALLRRIKPYFTEPLQPAAVRHRWVRQYFGHEVLGSQRGERFGLRPRDAARLARLSTEAADAIADGGYPVLGDLSDLRPPPAPASLPHPDDVSEAELLEVAGRAIDQMIQDVRELTEQRNRWRTAARRKSASAPRRLASAMARRAGNWSAR